MSFASVLPALQAILPAALPALGATFAPALAPRAFLLAIGYLHPRGASFLETSRYPEWCLRKPPRTPTSPSTCRPRRVSHRLREARPSRAPRARYPSSRNLGTRVSLLS